MTIVEFVVLLAVVGFVVWLLVTYVPMPEAVKKVIVAATVVVLILLTLRVLGLLPDTEVPRL